MKEKFDGLVEHLFSGNILLQEAVEILETRMIQRALQASAGNQSQASKRLGIHRNTLLRKMVQYGLAEPRRRTRRKPAKSEAARTRRPKSGVA
jgi:DNA-binding NtrC family response regulator